MTTWQVDSAGYLLTPSGAKAARVVDGALLLFDRRTHGEVPFTLADWVGVLWRASGAQLLEAEKKLPCTKSKS
jgi:hypothetical protein